MKGTVWQSHMLEWASVPSSVPFYLLNDWVLGKWALFALLLPADIGALFSEAGLLVEAGKNRLCQLMSRFCRTI